MLPHCRKVSRGPSVWRLHFLLLGSLASSQFKDICVRLVGDSMAAGVSGCLCVFWDSLGTCSGCTLPRSLLHLSGLWMVVFILWHFVLFSLFRHGVSQLPCRADSAQTHTSDIRAGRAQTIHPLNNHKGSVLGGRWKKGCCLAVYSSTAKLKWIESC